MNKTGRNVPSSRFVLTIGAKQFLKSSSSEQVKKDLEFGSKITIENEKIKGIGMKRRKMFPLKDLY